MKNVASITPTAISKRDTKAEGLAAAALGRQGRSVPLVYDAHTLLAGELPAYGKSFARRAIRALGEKLDGWLPRLAEHVVAVTDDIAAALSERHGLDPRRISVVPNGVEVDLFAAGAARVTSRRTPSIGSVVMS